MMQDIKVKDICLELSKTEFALVGISLQVTAALVREKHCNTPIEGEVKDLFDRSIDTTFLTGKEYMELMDKISKLAFALDLGVKHT